MDEVMTLVDGRSLGWATFGDPDGRPLVALHGSPDSRMIWRITDGAASRLGIRVIAPDRRGFGLSDPKPQRTVLDWVDDQRALTDHLGLERYPIVAVSGGSPYATAFAWSEAATITRLGLFSVIAPLHAPGVLDGTNRVVGTTFRIARRAPAPLGLFIARMMVRMVRRDPEAAMKRLLRTRPPADREVIERPEIREILRENLPNQFKDAGSIAHEMRLAARDWGFPLGEIRVPTTIWQGGLDDVHTPAMARHLATHIPDAKLEFEPQFATFNWIDRMDDILTALSPT